VVIPVQEGPRFKVGELKLSGNEHISGARLLEAIPLAGGKAYRPELLQTSLAKVEEAYWSEGYSDVVIGYSTSRRAEEGLVDVTLQVEEGRQSVVEKVEIEGRRNTSDKFVRGQVEIPPGTVLDFTRTSKARRNLYDTGAYSLVDIQAQPAPGGETIAEANRKPVTLNVKLREVRPFEIRYGGFYDTDRGPGFIADFANRNMLGSARVIGMRTRYDSDLQELRGYFSQPLLRRLPLKTNLIGYTRKELFDTFITDRIGFSVQQETRFRKSMILSYGYRFEQADTYDRDPESLFKLPPLNLAPLAFSFTRETRDELLDATRGSFVSQALEYAPARLGSDLRYVKYFGQYFKYLPLSKPAEIPWSGGLKRPRVVYAGGVRVGLGGGLSGQELIRSERFFTGGGTTIRGFPQNSIGPVDFLGDPRGGDAVFIANQELRFPAYGIFDGVGFVDLGNVYSRVGDFDPFSVRKAAGVGLRARTPYFLLRFDYGLKLDRRPGESRGGWFFSIGQAF
jgi:outer membrane protein assembly complex protein YaeT